MLLAAIANASFALPMKWMPRWFWKNIWSIWSVGSLLVFPFLAAFYTVASPRGWLPRGSRSSHRARSLLRIRLENRAGSLRAQRGSSAMRRQAIGMTAMDNFPSARQPGVMECELCANSWLVRVYLGRDPQTGRRNYHNHTSTVPFGRRSGSSISNRSSETRAARGARRPSRSTSSSTSGWQWWPGRD